jgi:hypothetical protein
MTHPREKISFIRVSQTQDPNTGDMVNVETIYYQPKAAQVNEVRSSTDIIAQQQNITQFLKVKLRYNPEIEILNGDFIEWRGFRFTNLSFKVDAYRRWIEVMCFSEIETTGRNAASS